MRPSRGPPPVGSRSREEQVMKRMLNAKLFACLRRPRHDLLREAFQEELVQCRLTRNNFAEGGRDVSEEEKAKLGGQHERRILHGEDCLRRVSASCL